MRRAREKFRAGWFVCGCVALLGAALLQAAPQAAAAAGTPVLTDAYVDNARYTPGTPVIVSAVVHESTGAGSWSGNVSYTLNHSVVVWRGSSQTGAINLDNVTLGS